MLEIIGIIFLANTNGKNAEARGRSPGPFKGLTFGLWFGGEVVGFFIGMLITDGEVYPAYAIALIFAILGGIASYLLAKNCPPGQATPSAAQYAPNSSIEGAWPLSDPCQITIEKEFGMDGSNIAQSVFLNGQYMGNLNNGERMQIQTSLVQNTIVMKDMYGNSILPLYFAVPSGGSAYVKFNIQRVLTEQCGGISVLSNADMLSLSQNLRNQASFGESQSFSPGFQQVNNPQEVSSQQFNQQPSNSQYVDQNASQYYDSQAGNPSQYYAQNSQTTESMSENPMLAVKIIIGAFAVNLVTLLLMFLLDDLVGYYLYRVGTMVSGPLRASWIYLMLQRDNKYKVYSVIAMLVASILWSFSSMVATSIITQNLSMYTVGYFFQLLFTNLITIILIGLAAFFVSILYKGSGKQKTRLCSLICAGVSMLLSMISTISAYASAYSLPTNYLVGMLTMNIISAAVLVIHINLIYTVCNFENKELITSSGVKIWFAVCIAITSIVILIVAINSGFLEVITLAPSIVGIAGYILMLNSKRIGYLVIVFAILSGITMSFNTAAFMYLDVFLQVLWNIFLNLLNPTITWFIIRKSWNGESTPQYRPPNSMM